MDTSSLRGGTLNLWDAAAAFTAVGAVTTYDHTATRQHIDGKSFVKAAVVAGVTPVVDVNTGLAFPALVGGASVANARGKGCIVVWGYNAAGVVKCAMGPHKQLGPIINAVENFEWDGPEFPAIPNDFCPVAYQVLKAGNAASATAIIFGTALWNAAGFTNVIQRVAYLPSRAQVS